MRKGVWASAALTGLLTTALVVGTMRTTGLQQHQGTSTGAGSPVATATVKSAAQIAAQDMARTTALSVRDARVALQLLANQLAFIQDVAVRPVFLKTVMMSHPKILSIQVQRWNQKRTEQVGTVADQSKLRETAAGVGRTQQFYLTDLYVRHQSTGNQSILPQAKKWTVTMGIPIMQAGKAVGVVIGDVDMSHMESVANQVDGEMGTHSTILSQSGKVVDIHGHSAQVTGVKSSQSIDGTKWNVTSTAVKQKPTVVTHIQKRVLVHMKKPISPSDIQRISSEIQGKLVRKGRRDTYVFESKSLDTPQLIQYFKKWGCKHAEPLTVYRQNELPNDEFYQTYQWNLPMIKADQAWKTSTGDPKVIVAVVDTGADLDHPEFQGQLVQGYNVLNGSNTPQDDNGHGTHVCGIIAARTNNVEGVASLDWNSKVMPVKALDQDGAGNVMDIADGITWAVDHGANVINLSLGQYEDNQYLHDAIKYAVSKNVTVVAAMGNDNSQRPSYPAAYPEVIAVAAVDENGNRASFSNYGGHASIAAPGVSIASTYPDHRYAAMSGTSMASPHIAGVVGLLHAVDQRITPDQVRRVLETTAMDRGDKGKDPYYGAGIVNVEAALTQVQNLSRGNDTQRTTNVPPQRHLSLFESLWGWLFGNTQSR